jgi:hypothetical protein
MFIKNLLKELERKGYLTYFNYANLKFTNIQERSCQVKDLIGEVPCPISMGALGHAVGGNISSLDASRQRCDVRPG